MDQKNYDYDRAELRRALERVGVKRGDVVFSHVGMGFLGYPANGKTLEAMFETILGAFHDALGDSGTLLVPTFSYSFCDKEIFDAQNTPSKIGYFTETFRKLPGVIRSVDPNFSVAGIGQQAAKLLNAVPLDSFGKDCIYERLVHVGGSICNIGVGFKYATFVHYAEEMHTVPYRFKKIFSGTILDRGCATDVEVVYNVRSGIDDTSTFPDLSRLEEDAKKNRSLKTEQVGKGLVTNILCKDLYDLCVRGMVKDPWYLAKGK